MYHIFATKLIRENGIEWWEKKLLDSKRVVKLTRGDFELAIDDLKKKLAGLNTCAGCTEPTCKTSGCIGA